MDKFFFDEYSEVEVRLALPEGLGAAEAKSRLILEAHPTTVKVSVRGEGGAVLLDANPLYEKIRPDETSWYIDGRYMVISMQKLVPRKWPALSDKEALESRFGPMNSSAAATEGRVVSPLKAHLPPVATDATNATDASGADGAGALAARSKVERLLRAAQSGNLEQLSEAADSLGEGEDSKAALRETKDAHGRGALHFAASKGKQETVLYLVKEAEVPPDVSDEKGETPLMLASREGHYQAAKCLLENGADPRAANESAVQAIHHAAGHGRTDLMRLLVEKGASVNAQSEAGPPLLFAIGHGHTEAVRTLLELGADPTAANKDGVTSLLTAAAAQETEIVEMLIKGGADVHSAAGAGVTPLFVAANEGNLRMLNALLEGGADPNTKDEEGALPITAAAAQGHREVVERLLPITRPCFGEQSERAEWTVEGLLRMATHPSSLHKSDAPMPQVEITDAQHPTVNSGGATSAEAGRSSKGEEAKARGDAAFKNQNYPEALDSYTQRYEDAANAFFEGVQLDSSNVQLAKAFQEAIEAGRKAHGTKVEGSKAESVEISAM